MQVSVFRWFSDKSFMKAVILCSFCTAFLLFSPDESKGQVGLFFDEFGAGAKAMAMGQAFTAVADDYSAAYYNPAGLTQTRNIFEGTIGYNYVKPRVLASFPGNATLNIRGQPSSRGVLIGFSSNLDMKRLIRVAPWFRRFSFGMIVWLSLPEMMQYHSGPVASRPHFLRQDDGFDLLAIAVSFGFEITRWLSVGAGFIPTADSSANEHSFEAVNKTYDPVGGLRLSVEQRAVTNPIPVAGPLIKPPLPIVEDLGFTIGLCFRAQRQEHWALLPGQEQISRRQRASAPIRGH